MKTPDEIKKGLGNDLACCSECSRGRPTHGNPYGCADRKHQIQIAEDALAYIQQLETKCNQLEKERDEMAEALHGECDVCVYYNSMSGKCAYCKHDADAWNVCEDNWEWRGVKE